ncbi:MAG: type II toxin-antitoxin system RelE/ParE family toxin [Chitinispirillaceae bacterium]|nr:type II toxin-antitoxin system RelE/ParE family toxin [Chitinispirillaceae bacterium]
MACKIIILPEVKDDLIDICRYVAVHDSLAHAEQLLDRLEEKCASLREHPERGQGVPELRRVFVDHFREVHFKPYRIIYQMSENTVFVHAVIDGRRELQELLERRVLR